MADQLHELHQLGNVCFAKGKYTAAIDAYSECICLSPRPVFYINRANCQLKREKWEEAAANCESALGLLASGHSRERIKAQYFLGKARIGQANWGAAIHALSTAHALCKEETVLFASDIRAALLTAEKRAWEARSEENLVAIHMLQEQLDIMSASFLPEDRKPFLRMGKDAVQMLMEREGQPSQKIPDHLKCQICYDIMLEPVITPCGISYDRGCLQTHLEARGPGNGTDPITGRPLQLEQLVPNRALRDAVELFLQERPWAYDCMED